MFFENDAPASTASFDSFLQMLGATTYWTDVASEYGVGQATKLLSTTLNENAPLSVDGGGVRTWLAAVDGGQDPKVSDGLLD